MGLVNLSQQLLVRVIFCLDFGGHGTMELLGMSGTYPYDM